MAQADFYLKIEGIDGESKDEKLAKHIEIMSWSWGESNSGSFAHGQGGGVGKVNMQDLSLSASISAASLHLFLACANGKHLSKAVLTCRKAGETPQVYLTITLNDILISSFQTGGSGGSELPIESFSLNFAKIEYEYFTQDEKGVVKSAGKKSWDLKANKASA